MTLNEQRFILDVNVLVSAALLKGSKPEQALKKAQISGQVLMSDSIWSELESVLARSKFDRYITQEERGRFLSNLAETVRFVEVTEQISECRDETDNKYLELAVSSNAEYIVTGDDDLLSLNPFRDIEILTVQEFIEDW